MKIVSVTGTIVLILVIAFLFFIYLGIYDVSAIKPHTGLVRWVLSTTMDNSVRRRAAGITAPPLTDAALVRSGSSYYQASCSGCHGAPGVAPAAFAKGLNPPPPNLAESVPDWTAAELFWIARNGVKMSGMPAFAPVHDDNQLWTLVVFLQRLPTLSPADYQALVKSGHE